MKSDRLGESQALQKRACRALSFTQGQKQHVPKTTQAVPFAEASRCFAQASESKRKEAKFALLSLHFSPALVAPVSDSCDGKARCVAVLSNGEEEEESKRGRG